MHLDTMGVPSLLLSLCLASIIGSFALSFSFDFCTPLVLGIPYLRNNPSPLLRPHPTPLHLRRPVALALSSLSSSFSSSSSSLNSRPIRIALTRESTEKNSALQSAILRRVSALLPSASRPVLEFVHVPCISHEAVDPLHPIPLESLPTMLHRLPSSPPPTANNYDLSYLLTSPNLYDYILVTSPESARVLLRLAASSSSSSSCSSSSSAAAAAAVVPPLLSGPVVSIGPTTTSILTACGLVPDFVPSSSTADALSRELPPRSSPLLSRLPPSSLGAASSPTSCRPRPCLVLYPTSSLSTRALSTSLSSRRLPAARFIVDQVASYGTTSAAASGTNIQSGVDVVCLGSPSAAVGWTNSWRRVGGGVDGVVGRQAASAPSSGRPREQQQQQQQQQHPPLAACIGGTTADECIRLECNSIGLKLWSGVLCRRSSPGMDGWVESVMEAVETIITARQT